MRFILREWESYWNYFMIIKTNYINYYLNVFVLFFFNLITYNKNKYLYLITQEKKLKDLHYFSSKFRNETEFLRFIFIRKLYW